MNGETITLKHDTNLPRPYSLGFRVQGTNGIWMDFNDSIYIEGKSPSHNWEPDKDYMKEYDHPLWKKYENLASGAGHGGMDWFLINAFVESVKNNVRPPLDVYDCATMRVITPLSENSIKNSGAPQKFIISLKGNGEIKNNFCVNKIIKFFVNLDNPNTNFNEKNYIFFINFLFPFFVIFSI